MCINYFFKIKYTYKLYAYVLRTRTSVKIVLKTYLIKTYSPKLYIKVICINFDILKMKSCENLSFSKKKTTDGRIKKGCGRTTSKKVL
jgi:hypothetical protein